MKAIKTTFIKTSNTNFLKAIIVGFVCGISSLILLLLLICALLMVSGTANPELIQWLDVAALSISVYISAFMTAKIIKRNGLIWGLIIGFSVYIIQLVSGFISSESNLTYISLVKLLAIVIFASVGGIKAVNKKEKLRIK